MALSTFQGAARGRARPLAQGAAAMPTLAGLLRAAIPKTLLGSALLLGRSLLSAGSAQAANN